MPKTQYPFFQESPSVQSSKELAIKFLNRVKEEIKDPKYQILFEDEKIFENFVEVFLLGHLNPMDSEAHLPIVVIGRKGSTMLTDVPVSRLCGVFLDRDFRLFLTRTEIFEAYFTAPSRVSKWLRGNVDLIKKVLERWGYSMHECLNAMLSDKAIHPLLNDKLNMKTLQFITEYLIEVKYRIPSNFGKNIIALLDEISPEKLFNIPRKYLSPLIEYGSAIVVYLKEMQPQVTLMEFLASEEFSQIMKVCEYIDELDDYPVSAKKVMEDVSYRQSLSMVLERLTEVRDFYLRMSEFDESDWRRRQTP